MTTSGRPRHDDSGGEGVSSVDVHLGGELVAQLPIEAGSVDVTPPPPADSAPDTTATRRSSDE